MSCSIVNSISLVEPIWKPFTKRKGFNPYAFYITHFEALTNNVNVINEIFPLYGPHWVKTELVIEHYFQSRLSKWNNDIKSGVKINIDNSVDEIKLHRRYLDKTYNYLLENNQNIRKLLKVNLMSNIDLMDYLETLKQLDLNNIK